MAEKQLKSITFKGLPGTYVIPEIDDSLSIEGTAADAQATGQRISDMLALIEELQASAGNAFAQALPEETYGDELPDAGTAGRIFFKKI